MSLAENLLNSLDETAYQNTRIGGIVPEEHIKVGQDRVITVPNSLKTIAVKGDKDIETATIDCVRYWDGHDLSTFAIYLNYILPNGDEGTYIPEGISKAEDTFSFDWLIGSEFTYAQGKMTFWIVAKLTDDSGTLIKQWSSFQNSDCTIAQGGDKIYVPEKQTDQDVISQAISISRSSAEIAEQQANLAQQAAGKAASDARDAAEEEVSRIIGELGVVQELGDSPNSVVSQLKVTKEFNKTNAKVNRNSKRITNIEQGLTPDSFETDDSVAYQKDVPANALPYAAVQKIGGMTRKCANLWDEIGVNGYYDSTNGAFMSGGGFFACENKIRVSPSTTYYITTPVATALCFFDAQQGFISYDTYGSSRAFTTPSNCYYMAFHVWHEYGITYKNDIMLNKGTTAQPYEPYFEGLHSAKVTEVKSVGVNMISFPYSKTSQTISGVTFNVNGDGTIQINGTSTLDIYFLLNEVEYSAGEHYCLSGCPSGGGKNTYMLYDDVNYKKDFGDGITFSYPKTTTGKIYIYISSGVTVSNLTFNPMLNKGSTAQPYTPYVKHTLPIPEGPANGINENVYDYIEWAEDGSVKKTVKCGKVDLGTFDWIYAGYYAYPLGLKAKAKAEGACLANVPSAITSYYINNYGDFLIFFDEGTYTDAETLKAAMSGVMLVYELAEPIVTDISDLITADNLIGVEGGGTLTFENEYKYAVPSEVEYQVEV